MNETVFDFQFDLPKIESWSVLAVGSYWHTWSNEVDQFSNYTETFLGLRPFVIWAQKPHDEVTSYACLSENEHEDLASAWLFVKL